MMDSHPLVIGVDADFMRRLDSQVAKIGAEYPGLKQTRSGVARTVLINWILQQEAEQAATNTRTQKD